MASAAGMRGAVLAVTVSIVAATSGCRSSEPVPPAPERSASARAASPVALRALRSAADRWVEPGARYEPDEAERARPAAGVALGGLRAPAIDGADGAPDDADDAGRLARESTASSRPRPGDDSGSQSALERHEAQRPAMGTLARIVLYAPDAAAAEAAFAAAWSRLEALEAVLSDYRPDSEVSRLSALSGTPAIPVSADLFAVLAAARGIAERSDGAFDVTVGRLSELWRDARVAGEAPDEARLADALARTGWQALQLDPATSRASVTLSGARLDLGGIGKGYAADELLTLLRARGVDRALVDIGGDVALGAAPPGEAGWRVAAPCAGETLVLADAAVATSGDGEQFVEIDGRRLSHVVDPRTGHALRDHSCVTVVAADGTTADALASAVGVLDTEDAVRLVASFPGARLLGDRTRRHRPLVGSDVRARIASGRWTRESGVLTGQVDDDGRALYVVSDAVPAAFDLDADLRSTGAPGTAVLWFGRGAGRPASGIEVPLAPKAGQRGPWSRLAARARGFDVELSGTLGGRTSTTRDDGPDDMARGTLAFEVQGAGARVELRELRLLGRDLFDDLAFEDLGAGRVRPTPEARIAGWASVGSSAAFFDETGESIEVVGTPDGYRIERRELAVPARGGGHLRTREDYEDFRLRLDVNLAPMANSGLFLRGDRAGGDPAYAGWEIQLIDDGNWGRVTGTPLGAWQQFGSVYGVRPPDVEDAEHAPGEWSRVEVLFRGDRLAVAVNGLVLHDVDVASLDADPRASERPRRGFLGLQRYDCVHVEGETALGVRNVFVQRL